MQIFNAFVMCLALGPSLAHAVHTPLNQGWVITQAESSPFDLPNTVLGALGSTLNNGHDPYLRWLTLPGLPQSPLSNFIKLPMPEGSPFRTPWVFSKKFRIPKGFQNHILRLRGIHYRANVRINGKLVADSHQIQGPFRTFDLNITRALISPSLEQDDQLIELEISAPLPQDLGSGWVDWAPTPPDKNLGVLDSVSLHSVGKIMARNPNVSTSLSRDLKEATVTASIELNNLEHSTEKDLPAKVNVTLAGMHQSKSVILPPRGKREVFFEFRLKNPKLWWPKPLGNPHLEKFTYQVHAPTLSDQGEISFGVREIRSEVRKSGERVFIVNQRPILIRGAGWVNDLLGRNVDLESKIKLVSELGLNALRLEGHFESDRFYELTDREGILVFAGLSCCDRWEQWKTWTQENLHVAKSTVRDLALRLRSHPSIAAFFLASDYIPPREIETAYRKILNETRWPNPIVAAAHGNSKSEVSGPTGVKMTGPYEYVPESYWLKDTRRGGAFGFNMETSPGLSLLPSHGKLRTPWWTEDLALHGLGSEFVGVGPGWEALKYKFGGDPSEPGLKGQMMAYDLHRAMFEGFARNWDRRATGIIAWQLTSPWPRTHWQMFGYNLETGGAYYGSKAALRPLHIIYGYDDMGVSVFNGTQMHYDRLDVRVKVFDSSLKEVFNRQTEITAGAHSISRIADLSLNPIALGLSGHYVVFLELFQTLNGTTERLDQNAYALHSQDDVIHFDKTNWQFTPVSKHSPRSDTSSLPMATLEAKANFQNNSLVIEIKNTSDVVALYVTGEIAGWPNAHWSDRFFSLLPGQSKTVTLSNWATQAEPKQLRLFGLNVRPYQTNPK